MRRFLFFLFLPFFFSPVFAQDTAPITEYSPVIVTPVAWFSSGDAACSAGLAFRNKSAVSPYSFSAGSPFFIAPTSCEVNRTSPRDGVEKGYGFTLQTRRSCPSGATLVGDVCKCPAGATCGTDSCSAKAGGLSTLNFTVGWARSGKADARDWIGAQTYPGYSSPVCASGCSQELTGDDSGNSCYRSEVPAATGLHRISCDYSVRSTGKSCTPGPADAAHDSKTPPEPCPGFTGEVNGETKCVGTASKPIPAPSGQGVAGATGRGEQSGNPTAGTKPSSGEGSGSDGPGRTPTAGTGTASGGPAGAAGNGTKPDGTTTKPTEGKEQAACGAPGQAKCSINEAGTPDGKGSFDEAKGEMEAQGKRQLDGLDGIKRTDDKDTSWGVIPSWIAHGECSPWNLGTLPLGPGIPIEVDICRIVPYVNAVSNFLWAVFTFFATISMVFRVTTATKD